MKTKFHECLTKLRKLRGYTQAQIAEKIGVSRSTYTNYESGNRTPDYEVLERISEVLVCSLDELFGRTQSYVSDCDTVRDKQVSYHVAERVGELPRLAIIPTSMPDDMYQKIMAKLDGKGVMIVVDATRDLLMNVLAYHPFLIKPNNHELGEIFDVELLTRESVVPYAKKLQEKGARNVLVSMAGEGAVLVAEDGSVYDAPAPKGELKNGVGAGDSMVAGFMAGWMEKQEYRHAFHMGVASGSASAFSENLATKEEIAGVYQQVVKEER